MVGALVGAPASTVGHKLGLVVGKAVRVGLAVDNPASIEGAAEVGK